MSNDTSQLYNVVAVNIENGERRLIAERKTHSNAEAIVSMAVMRRGCDVEFYTTEPVEQQQ